MKRKTLEKAFVLAVFGLIYVVLAENVSLIGHVIALPEFSASGAQADAAFGVLEQKNYFFEMQGHLNLVLMGLQPGNNVLVRDEDRTYSLTVLRVLQDYPTGTEQVSLLVSPTSKRITLHEGDAAVVDFNLDGVGDVRVELLSVAHGAASLSIRSP